MINQSIIQQRGRVSFPEFMDTKAYMLELKEGRVPDYLKAWQQTVDEMLVGIDPQICYLMIHQKIVQEGKSQRVPGLHVDGYWRPATRGHHPIHSMSAGHNSVPPSWDGGMGVRWDEVDFSIPEATLLATDIQASRAFIGQWEGKPNEKGDCSHIDVSAMDDITLASGICYAGNISMLHESLPVTETVQRTLVRITVPGWSPEL